MGKGPLTLSMLSTPSLNMLPPQPRNIFQPQPWMSPTPMDMVDPEKSPRKKHYFQPVTTADVEARRALGINRARPRARMAKNPDESLIRD